MIGTSIPDDCRQGYEALARGAWIDARTAFDSVIAGRESPEALEGLGLAAWWLDLAEVMFDARERAYRLYRQRNEVVAAARIAVWLAWDYWAFRGENAVANGWFQRARRLLDDQPVCAERAWLEVREGSLALFEDHDPDRAHLLASEGIAVARTVGSMDLEMLGRAVQGLALVMSGAVAEGMRALDEVNATVVAGEMHDFVAIGLACCYMVAGCDHIRDYDRAVQWCTRLKAFCAKWGLRPLFAVCRTQYASICMWRGTWLEAEQELSAAAEELEASRPAMMADPIVRLAELRRRQGRLAEAASLFDQAEPHPLASLGRAALALDRGDARAGADFAARYLRRLPPQSRVDRALGLEILARAQAQAGETEHAAIALTELESIAAMVKTIPLRATASRAAGTVAMATGAIDEARRHFEDAIDRFLQSGAPYELACTRIRLAEVLSQLGRRNEAILEARRSIDLLSELKAEFDMVRARTLLDALSASLDSPSPPEGSTAAGLTARELEVLRLVAEGLNNQAIAERLFLSDHTIHRHIANIFNKLSVSSRAAAVAQAARRGLIA